MYWSSYIAWLVFGWFGLAGWLACCCRLVQCTTGEDAPGAPEAGRDDANFPPFLGAPEPGRLAGTGAGEAEGAGTGSSVDMTGSASADGVTLPAEGFDPALAVVLLGFPPGLVPLGGVFLGAPPTAGDGSGGLDTSTGSSDGFELAVDLVPGRPLVPLLLPLACCFGPAGSTTGGEAPREIFATPSLTGLEMSLTSSPALETAADAAGAPLPAFWAEAARAPPDVLVTGGMLVCLPALCTL